MHKFHSLLIQARQYCSSDIETELSHEGLIVRFSNGREQVIHAERRDGYYILTSVVFGKNRVEEIGRFDILTTIWMRNRETVAVGFELDKGGRLIGRIDQPADTIDPPELQFYIESLARECDWLEYVLTG